jgi:spore germination protein
VLLCFLEVIDLVIHRVEAGQTIEEIARVYGVTVQSIVDVNGLTQPQNLVTGMNLVIPVGDAASAAEGAHIINPGETLWSISKKYSMPLAKLVAVNRIPMPYTAEAGQKLRVLQNGPPLETLGYISPGAAAGAANIVREIGPNLTYLGYFELPVSATGAIQGTINQEILAASREVNAALLPVFTNQLEGEFDSDLGHTIVADATVRQNFINNVLAMLNQNNLRGAIIDFENLYPADRNLFTQFIKQLAQALHNAGKILILNMAPKWEDLPNAPWTGFFDYAALGPLVDRAALMTYEWGYISGPPDPTAPLPNVRRVLDYAMANNIPASKILMGMTLYGYDWELPDTPDNLASTVTLPRVWELARQFHSVIEFDETAGQPFMRYTNAQGVQHIIWFEDARSHYLKYQLAKELGLRGVFYWIISQPFPATYYMVTHLFTVVKL